MEDNIFSQVSSWVNETSQKAFDKLKKKIKPQDEYWTELQKDAENMYQLLRDQRYIAMQRFLDNLKKELENSLSIVLTKDFKDYTREARADKAAIISAMINIVELIKNEPERVIDIIKKKELI